MRSPYAVDLASVNTQREDQLDEVRSRPGRRSGAGPAPAASPSTVHSVCGIRADGSSVTCVEALGEQGRHRHPGRLAPLDGELAAHHDRGAVAALQEQLGTGHAHVGGPGRQVHHGQRRVVAGLAGPRRWAPPGRPGPIGRRPVGDVVGDREGPAAAVGAADGRRCRRRCRSTSRAWRRCGSAGPPRALRSVRWPSAPHVAPRLRQLRVGRPHHEVAALHGVGQLGGQVLELPLARLEPLEDRLGHVAELVAPGRPGRPRTAGTACAAARRGRCRRCSGRRRPRPGPTTRSRLRIAVDVDDDRARHRRRRRAPPPSSATASSALCGKSAVRPRLRRSRPGSSHGQLAARSPVDRAPCPPGSTSSAVGRTSPSAMRPSSNWISAADRNMPEPLRISALLAPSSR